MLLAGALLKMGAYGILRYLMPLFVGSLSALAPLAIALAVIGIIYGALVAFAQTDLKKLIAYSSVSHLGFVVLGLFACNEEAVSGAALQMINHGLSTGALFLIVGMIYQRAHTKQISELGGIWADAPILSAFFLFFTFASIGLPGLNNFVGEFLVLVGTFQENVLAAVLAATGVVLAAIYMLSMFRRVVFRDRGPGKATASPISPVGRSSFWRSSRCQPWPWVSTRSPPCGPWSARSPNSSSRCGVTSSSWVRSPPVWTRRRARERRVAPA